MSRITSPSLLLLIALSSCGSPDKAAESTADAGLADDADSNDDAGQTEDAARPTADQGVLDASPTLDSAVAGSALLPGDEAALALAALPAREPAAVEPEDTVGEVLLTRLRVVLEPDATIGEFNAAALAVGATGINFSAPGSPDFTWSLPRAADVTALEALAAMLDGQPGIAYADAGRQFTPLELPNANGSTALSLELQHALATRFPAAWNVRQVAARDCEGRRVTVLVPDFYRAPHALYDTQVVPAAANTDRVTEPTMAAVPGEFLDEQAHGYRTSSLLTARFDDLRPHGANPLPGCLNLKLVNCAGRDISECLLGQLKPAVEATAGPLIISSSLGFINNRVCGVSGDEDCGLATDVNDREVIRIHARLDRRLTEAAKWADFAMRPEIVARVLVVQAAGNDGSFTALGKAWPGLGDARLSSTFGMAAALGDLDDLLTNAALWQPTDASLRSLAFSADALATVKEHRDAELTIPVTDRNLLVVGSLDDADRFEDLKRSEFSSSGATILAVGTDMITLDEPSVPGEDGSGLRGTSYSTPQVAGLASLLWLLDDEPGAGGLDLGARPPEDTIRLLRATSRNNGTTTGILDAYGAVLALDARKNSQRMRRALLDVTGPGDAPDGVFDTSDARAFLEAFERENPEGRESMVRDDSRFDLNGDGFTGGGRAGPFDLDAGALGPDGAPILGLVQAEIEGEDVEFGEAGVSDLDVLCFYAYGRLGLFDLTGGESVERRTDMLGTACGAGSVMNPVTFYEGQITLEFDNERENFIFEQGTSPGGGTIINFEGSLLRTFTGRYTYDVRCESLRGCTFLGASGSANRSIETVLPATADDNLAGRPCVLSSEWSISGSGTSIDDPAVAIASSQFGFDNDDGVPVVDFSLKPFDEVLTCAVRGEVVDTFPDGCMGDLPPDVDCSANPLVTNPFRARAPLGSPNQPAPAAAVGSVDAAEARISWNLRFVEE